MFFAHQNSSEKEKYIRYLTLIGSLSNLFSESEVPYLYYRVAEKLFCRAFNADDLARSDVSADAKKNNLGIGLKTFLQGNNRTIQKVAEFNRDRSLYHNLELEDLILKIAKLRNDRINFTESLHGLDRSIYHCVLRDSGGFRIYEESMDKIQIDHISRIKKNGNSIYFQDGLHEYVFSLAKSTLQKRFVVSSTLCDFEVNILADPLAELFALLEEDFSKSISNPSQQNFIYLPLFSIRDRKIGEKSGLNQWNAGGRPRHSNEIYIPVPAEIHRNFPNFFPPRDTHFNLLLPDGESVESKICQQGGKALMSQSNRRLGKLILRDGLNLREGELATYQKLQDFGIDSVRIDKNLDGDYEINFAQAGSYDSFRENFL